MPWLRYSNSFSKLAHLFSEPTHVWNSVNIEIEFSVFILLDGADRTLGFKTLVELRRVEFTFNGNILESAWSSDNTVIETQAVTQEIYCRYQLFHVWEIAFDKIHELGQLTILLLICAFHFLHLFGLLSFPLSGFFFKFNDAVLQGGVLPFQCLDLVAAEKRTDTLGDVGGCDGCRPFQLLGLYFFFRPS